MKSNINDKDRIRPLIYPYIPINIVFTIQTTLPKNKRERLRARFGKRLLQLLFSFESANLRMQFFVVSCILFKF